MSTKKDFSQDANSIFPVDITKKPAEQLTSQSAAAPIQRAETKEPTNSGDNLIRRTYYITEDIYKALKIKAASSDNPAEKDQSAIVRAALKQYLDL